MEYLQLNKLAALVFGKAISSVTISKDEVKCRVERHCAFKIHIEHIKSCFLISAAT
jgi:hypothetical protein